MFEEIMEVMKRAGIFMIIVQTIMHLCVGDSYEKYIKMLVGIITAVMLIAPVVNLFKGERVESFENYRIEYERKLFGDEVDFETIRDEGWKNNLQQETYGMEGFEE